MSRLTGGSGYEGGVNMPSPVRAPAPLEFRQHIPMPWWHRASRQQLGALVVLFTLVLFLVNFVADRLLVREWHTPVVMMAVSDAVAATVIGYLVWRLVDYSYQRRQRLAERLEMIAELNHHVRNALETISLSAYTTQNRDAMKAINEAVQRIDWALREILPIAKR